MNPTWTTWANLPLTVTVAWLSVGRKTGTTIYYLYAACYAVVYLATVILFLASVLTAAALRGNPFFVVLGIFSIFLFLAVWLVGSRHFQRETAEMELRIKYSNAARTFRKERRIDLEDRIKLEYGFVPEHLIPAAGKPGPATKKEEALIQEIGLLLQGHAPRRTGEGALPSSLPAASGETGTIDPNRADRTSLASHPAIGTTLALEIVRNRERHGPFLSLDDLCRRCAVKPHLRVRLEAAIEFQPESPPPPAPSKRATRKPGQSRRID